ncbi:uncharacterized protein LOC142236024 [Haematobia irritans]|uniref:uncharacterized protein LOC142236024 n=1 Tax=Haematobia irritans TaxID=7368 RepID=UPI003F500C8F
MYRQIMVHPEDRAFQRILFQSYPNSPVKDYQLKTVTFGVSCAPFLAIRTLLQLATDSANQYPTVASTLRQETYVDDILSGGFSIEETIEAQTKLISVLKSAGFPLKKLTANDSCLLAHLPQEDLYDLNFLRLNESSSTKTLGINWNALKDAFSYSCSNIEIRADYTKRQVLAAVAQLFDPAGWLTPVIIKAKILMQQLWLEGLGWDDSISSDALQTWNQILNDLPHIEHISVPRWIQLLPEDSIEIHGFCDASKAAYCACVYVRCKTSTATVFSNLLIAKSKVAPIKQIPLPKLELNGAVLLAKLIKYVVGIFQVEFDSITLWRDASIVLGWLSKPPRSWETYVANRTALIHDIVPNVKWRHVPTHENPADLGTRGCRPQDLTSNPLWWYGPSWMTTPEFNWPNRNPLTTNLPAEIVQSYQVTTESVDILERFSSYTKALRVLSYVFRFFFNSHPSIGNSQRFQTIRVSTTELQNVKNRLLSLAQRQFYSNEYNSLRSSAPIGKKSHLSTLNPFLDCDNLMRVNGRLSNSSLPYKERYPIILPGKSRFCFLYLSHLHTFLAHGECILMCRFVQTEFYVPRLKSLVKTIIHKYRCTLAPPFHTTGIDFAGPFDLKSSSLRKSPIIKGYVSVFVCFATKAIHLEACSELSSAAFEAAFARFVGRRGLPHRIVSDNGRNFLGASRNLTREFAKFLRCTSTDIAEKYATYGFEWKFIPPHAPHMGGLWEAAVKSFKIHFKKITGSHRFTFEQFSTILARIEGVLNSRPISAISEDPADLTALTTGHSLKGAPIVALPEPISQNLSLVNRWTKLKALHHQFSLRWKNYYLKSMQKRYKWKTPSCNLKIDDLVVILDDLLPPNEWRLGRIINTYPGSDQNVRIADVRTATGFVNRPITKLCYLPLCDNLPSDQESPRTQQRKRDTYMYKGNTTVAMEKSEYQQRMMNIISDMMMYQRINKDPTTSLQRNKYIQQ